MLSKLLVRNYALIEKIEINFSQSLNIITGETGAGKSILLGAIELLLGGRADKNQIYNPEQKCIAEATFSPVNATIKTLLEIHDLDDFSDGLIIRREVSPNGKSRAFINDTPVTVAKVRAFGSALIDLNRQHDLLDVQNVDFHYQLIDSIALSKSELKEYTLGYSQLKKFEKEIENLRIEYNQSTKDQNYLKFQLNEVDELGLEEGEYESLEQKIEKISRLQDIITLTKQSDDMLVSNDASIIEKLRELYNSWSDLSSIGPKYNNIAERLLSVMEEITDMGSSISGFDLDINRDESLEELEAKRDNIANILLKHQVNDVSALFELADEWRSKMSSSDNLEQKISNIEGEIRKLQKNLMVKAKAISKKRKANFKKIESAVDTMLSGLLMEHAKIKVSHSVVEQLGKHGIDDIEILFSSNKGGNFRPIKGIASGGELSRLMLCMKTTAAESIEFPTLIFDEIDTGVSGEVAHKMGEMLQAISNEHQVIVITHSPQVAAKANQHFEVVKNDEGKRSVSEIKQLSEGDRVMAIAKMLSGNAPSRTALDNARELLEAV